MCVCVCPHVVPLRFAASVLLAVTLQCAKTGGGRLSWEGGRGEATALYDCAAGNNRNRRRHCLWGKLLI